MKTTTESKVLIAHLRGGLANQMGVYAAAKALAERHDAKLKLDLSYFHEGRERNYELDKLCVSAEIASKREVSRALGSRFKFIQRWRRSYFRKSGMADPRVYRENLKTALNHDGQFFERCPEILFGDFPSIWYYQDILPDLRREFEISKPISAETARFLDKIRHVPAVSVHVRRGDYAHDPKTTRLHGLLGVDYYQVAIDRMEELVPDCEFFVFSDDTPWAIANLRSSRPMHPVTCNSVNAGYQDYHLMRNCRHHIIANSGFSRWPALLNDRSDKQVIMPKQWVRAFDFNPEDIAPANWMRL